MIRGQALLYKTEYLRACKSPLKAKTALGEKYYEEVDDSVMDEAKQEITNIIREGYDDEILNVMVPANDVVPE